MQVLLIEMKVQKIQVEASSFNHRGAARYHNIYKIEPPSFQHHLA